ncbi:hypothetical protein DWUX_333 [Desulfovibrio diazotrophicus]|nr:hypothetical protein DWUX_333 [Desulfovibrio diazotrophicus]
MKNPCTVGLRGGEVRPDGVRQFGRSAFFGLNRLELRQLVGEADVRSKPGRISHSLSLKKNGVVISVAPRVAIRRCAAKKRRNTGLLQACKPSPDGKKDRPP